MSQLSEFFKHRTYIIEEAVSYLEDHADNLTGPQKAAVVVGIMKQLHISVGGIWGMLLEQAVLTAIDYELARIRQHHKPPAQPVPPVAASIYDTPEDGQLPSDSDLITRGFAQGDNKWTNRTVLQWQITHPGGVLNGTIWNLVGPIGGQPL